MEKLVGHYFSPVPTEQLVQMKEKCGIDVTKALMLYILGLSFMMTLLLILYQKVNTASSR